MGKASEAGLLALFSLVLLLDAVEEGRSGFAVMWAVNVGIWLIVVGARLAESDRQEHGK